MARAHTDFDAMMREHLRPVTAYAMSVSPTRDIAEEAVQETFIRAWRYSSSFRGDSSPLTWLISICRRVVVDLGQRERGHRHEVLPEQLPSVNDPFEMTTVMHMMSSLPLPQREVMVLCAVLGFDYDTAASILSVPVGTVRSRLARARAALVEAHADGIAV